MNENVDKFRRGRLKSVRNIQGSERSMMGKQCHMEDANATARPTLYRTQSVFVSIESGVFGLCVSFSY